MEKKEEQKKEARQAKRQKTCTDETGKSSGIEIASKKEEKNVRVSIGECTDIDLLQSLLDRPISRGKKQRIKKKISTLKNPQDANGESKAEK